jgi:hypothetical protein
MTQLKRKRVLAAKIETTSGTAESLTASDAAFNAYDVVFQNETEMEEREGQGGFGRIASVPGGYKGRATFKTDCPWDGTATEPSWADTFLPACGVVKATNTFTPRTEAPGANVKTLTLGCYYDGSLKMLSGCAGTGKLVCPTGKAAYWEWDFQGVWIEPSDASILSPTYPTALPMRYANSTTTFNSVALCLSNITFDIGNTVTMIECASGNGFARAMVTDRRPTVTGDPESKLMATQNRHALMLAMTEGILTWDLDGPTNGKMTVSAPKAQLIANSEADRAGLVTDNLEWQLNRNGSTIDQEFTILFTPAT